MNDKLKRYYELKTKIRALTSEMEELQPEIINYVALETEKEELKTPYGTFKLKRSDKWTYSQELQEKEQLLKDKIKVLKKEEEIKGIAQREKAGFSLVFLFNKGV
jgi:hypothetical protein